MTEIVCELCAECENDGCLLCCYFRVYGEHSEHLCPDCAEDGVTLRSGLNEPSPSDERLADALSHYRRIFPARRQPSGTMAKGWEHG